MSPRAYSCYGSGRRIGIVEDAARLSVGLVLGDEDAHMFELYDAEFIDVDVEVELGRDCWGEKDILQRIGITRVKLRRIEIRP